jgi:hypothetical protein
MLRIKNTGRGIGGWKFKVPHTGNTITGGEYFDLWKNVRSHYKANGYTPITEHEFQDILCQNAPYGADFCVPYDPADPVPKPQKRGTTIDHLIRFAKAMKNALTKGGGAIVPKEEAERRAAICARCPMNGKAAGCTPCRGLLNYVSKAIGNLKTSFDNRLQACTVCGCELRVSVWVDLESQVKDLSEAVREEFPKAWCWKAAQSA